MSSPSEQMGHPFAYFHGGASETVDRPAAVSASAAQPCIIRVQTNTGLTTTFGRLAYPDGAEKQAGTAPFVKLRTFSMVPAVSIHFLARNKHVDPAVVDPFSTFCEVTFTGNTMSNNPTLGDLNIPSVGFTEPSIHMAGGPKVAAAQREAGNDAARLVASQLGVQENDVCVITMYVGRRAPVIMGILPSESTNPIFEARTHAVVSAVKIDIALACNPGVPSTALWLQGLFELRHLHEHNPSGASSNPPMDLFWYRSDHNASYTFHEDEETGEISYAKAQFFAFNLLNQRMQVPMPPWLIGQRQSREVQDRTGAGGHLTIDEISPYSVDRLPILPDRRVFEGFIFISLLREMQAVTDAAHDTFNRNKKHPCTFDRVHSTLYFRITVNATTDTSGPSLLPGTRVIVMREDIVYDGVISSTPASTRLVIFARTSHKASFSSTGLESCPVVVQSCHGLIMAKAKAVCHFIEMQPSGSFDHRPLLWGNHNPQASLHRDLVSEAVEAAAQAGINIGWSLNTIQALRSELDASQKIAFDKALTRVVGGTTIINGPGGTGKSHTLVAIVISAVLLGHKVKVAMPSNKPLEEFLGRLVKKSRELNVEGQVRTVRVYTSGTERTAEGHDDSDREGHANDASWVQELMTEHERRFLTESYTGLEYALSSQIKDWAHRNAGRHGYDPDVEDPTDPTIASRYLDLRAAILTSDEQDGLSKKEKNVFTGLHADIRRKVLANATVCLATPAKCGMVDDFGATFLVFDEAGAASILDLCQAITRNDSIQVAVFAGDIQQLPPTDVAGSMSKSELSAWAYRPLLDHVQLAFNRKANCLMVQYRSHPDLREIMTPLVYGTPFVDGYRPMDPSLVAGVLDFMRHGRFSAAFSNVHKREVLINVNSIDTRPSSSTSRYNLGSIGAMVMFLVELCGWIPDTDREYVVHGAKVVPRRVRLSDVGLMAAYKDHVKVLGSILDQVAMNGGCLDELSSLKVSTVDGYQGGERSIVLFDPVVARVGSIPYEFAGERHRLNTSLTRGKEFNFIFCNVSAIKKTKFTGKKVEIFRSYTTTAMRTRPVVQWDAGPTVQTILTQTGPAVDQTREWRNAITYPEGGLDSIDYPNFV